MNKTAAHNTSTSNQHQQAKSSSSNKEQGSFWQGGETMRSESFFGGNAETSTQPFFLQRKCGVCDQEEKVQKKGILGIQRMPAFESESTAPIQTKLTVGRPNDKYEREADLTADRVVRELANPGPKSIETNTSSKEFTPVSPSPTTPGIQNKCTACEQEENHTEESGEVEVPSVQTIPAFESPPDEGNSIVQPQRMPSLQRSHTNEDKDDHAPLQTKGSSSTPKVSSSLESRLSSSKGKGNPLSENTRGSMEGAFGKDFRQVRVHTGSEAVQMNKELGAQAFTNGNDIYFNSGKYDTESSGGKHLLAHELTHTVQQGGGVNRSLIQRQNQEGEELSDQEKEKMLSGALVTSKEENEKVVNEAIQNNPDEEVETDQLVEEAADESEIEEGAKNEDGETKKGEVQPEEGQLGDVGPGFEPVVPESPAQKEDAEAPPASQVIGSTTKSPTIDNFILEISQKRENLIQQVNTRNNQIKEYSIQEKIRINAEFANQRNVFESSLLTAFNEAELKKNLFLEKISKYESKKKGFIEAGAKKNQGDLSRDITEKKRALLEAAEQMAVKATDIGKREAWRVKKAADEEVLKINSLTTSKIRQYSSYDRANRIARVLGEMKAEAIGKVRDSSGKTSSKIREDAAELAKKFRKEAREGVKKFEETREPTKQKIEDEKRKGIDLLTQTIQEVKIQFNKAQTEFFENLKKMRVQGIDAIDNAERILENTIDKHEVVALNELHGAQNESLEKLDQFLIDFTADVEDIPESLAAKIVKAARPTLDDIFIKFENATSLLETNFHLVVETDSSQQLTQSQTNVDRLDVKAWEALQSFVESVDQIEKAYQEALDPKLDKEIPNAMTVFVTTNRDELQRGIDDSKGNWEKELKDGEKEMIKKADDVILKISTTAADLGPKMDKKANEIENESIWSRIGNWALGILSGFFKGFLNFIWTIIKIALLILAVVAVILLIAFLIGGIAGLLAALAVIIKIAAVVLPILAYAAIAFAVIGLIMGGFKIYLGISRDDLDDFDRGELVGGGLFDIGESLVDLKIFRILDKLAKGEKLFGFADDVSSFKRIVDLVGDANQAKKIVDTVGDVRKAEDLIELVGDVNRLEKLLTKSSDVTKLKKVLEEIGDAQKLESILAKADDISDVDRLLTRIGDADQLVDFFKYAEHAQDIERALDNVGDAKKLADILDYPAIKSIDEVNDLMKKVDDADQLIKLLDKVSDANQLLKLLDKVGDADQLLKLLDKVDDVQDLTKLLDKVSDVQKLITVLDKVSDGGKLAKLLNEVSDSNKLLKFLDAVDPASLQKFMNLPNGHQKILADLPQNVLNSISQNPSKRQLEILDEVEEVKRVFDLDQRFDVTTSSGATQSKLGHTFKEHGAHITDAEMFNLANSQGILKSRWSSFKLQDFWTNFVLNKIKDPSTPQGMFSPINSRGWREINRGNLTVQEILNDIQRYRRYLKKKIEVKNHPVSGAGKGFEPDGVTKRDLDFITVVVMLDDTNIFRILTGFPSNP